MESIAVAAVGTAPDQLARDLNWFGLLFESLVVRDLAGYAQVHTVKCGAPCALGVITGTGYGYVRKDGIHVIPIGGLGP